MPGPYEQLTQVMDNLEKHYRICRTSSSPSSRANCSCLQTRTGKRTAAAALKIAVDMVDEGLINEVEGVGRVQPEQLDQLLHPRLDPDAKYDIIAKGLPASPGAAVGE